MDGDAIPVEGHALCQQAISAPCCGGDHRRAGIQDTLAPILPGPDRCHYAMAGHARA